MSQYMDKIAGDAYWRSLDQLRKSPQYRRFLEAEFPDTTDDGDSGISRRRFLSLMGASMALAGLAGCRKPVEKIIPYVSQPEEVVPGIPSYYATAMPFGLSAYGLIVECHEGRPTKIEGNPRHPSTLGRSNAFMQAEILNLYDPDRSDKVLHKAAESSWDAFVSFWRGQQAALLAARGEGLALLTEHFASPTLSRLYAEVRRRFPLANIAAYDPISERHHMAACSRIGLPAYSLDCRYDKAEVILSLDADFLLTEAEHVAAAARFAEGRTITGTAGAMNRLYVVEPELSVTGAMADHRVRIPRSMIGTYAGLLAAELAHQGISSGLENSVDKTAGHGVAQKFINIVAKDLAEHAGRCLIVAGRTQPPAVHLTAMALNKALGNVGSTVTYRELKDTSYNISGAMAEDISALEQALHDGSVSTLILLGGNPVYQAPASIHFADALKKTEHVIHLSSHVDETSHAAEWHIPRAHFLESWGDTRAQDGTLSIVQPMIEPLLNGRGDCELMELVSSGRDRRGYDIVRETWQTLLPAADFESAWRRVLHDGIYTGDMPPSGEPPPVTAAISTYIRESLATTAEYPTSESLELTIQVSPSVYDGRYANNGWLQELPHPVSKLTWDNAACVSPATARERGLRNGDVVTLASGSATVELPIWIVPGLAVNTISAALGYGRTAAGRVGNDVGVNIYPLRPTPDAYFVRNVKLGKTGRTYRLASTQDHGAMEGRPIVREAERDLYRRQPEFARDMVEHPPLVGIYPEHDYSRGYQWGMAVDLTLCIGCNACTIACQSENNIPVVGKAQVAKGREMHWMRLDRYFVGGPDEPLMVFMPMACQHCENAPCESVCPVAATVHDSEGINVMTYNRCIGTRYCSNNCPYKVRRFNFFNYTRHLPELVQMAMNPDVTVRSRGVMEKCTFCIQRINRGKIKARQEGRIVRDGEIVTACQQACPTGAIVFGNINDSAGRVTKVRANDRAYDLLGELNTRPRNAYLARIRNPHPELRENTGGNG